MNKKELMEKFRMTFGSPGKDAFFSPGRINLIGEHVDYNGGYAMPCAISLGTYGVYSDRNDQIVALYSENIGDGIVQFDLNELQSEANEKHAWINYFKGMLKYLQEKTSKIDHGFNLYIYGNLPYGAGLSSSASIEMLIGTVLNEEFNLNVDRVALAKLGQKTENKYIGLNSGIMDQFACIMGKKDQVLLLNCQNLDYRYKSLNLNNYRLIIMSTNKKHSLADSSYNNRVDDCQNALKKLQSKLDIHYLCDLNCKTLDEYSYLINNEMQLCCARHVVTENNRTLRATKALDENNLSLLGHLLNASHISLHYNYQVTGKELDTLTEAAWLQPGCLGSRMIGGGFGGSAIAIVRKDQAEDFKKNVGQVYRDKIGYKASFYDTEIVDGTKKI